MAMKNEKNEDLEEALKLLLLDAVAGIMRYSNIA